MQSKYESNPLILSSAILVFPYTAVTFTNKNSIFGKMVKNFALKAEKFILSLSKDINGEKVPHKISLLVKASYLERTNQIYLEGLQLVQVHYIEQNSDDPYDILGFFSPVEEKEDLIPITNQLNYARVRRYFKEYVQTKIENPIAKAELLGSLHRPHFVIHSLANLLLQYPQTGQKILEAQSWTERIEIILTNFSQLPPIISPKKDEPPTPKKELKHTFRREID